jgi:chloramphenicol 3-O-phosphotransferase
MSIQAPVHRTARLEPKVLCAIVAKVRTVARVLLTGMSGAGKSSVLVALQRRGHIVVDTDYDGWTLPDGTWEPSTPWSRFCVGCDGRTGWTTSAG